MDRLITLILIIVGLINFFPLIGIASPDVLAELYGIQAPAGEILILLKHRALLFGIIGALIIISAFKPSFQKLAIFVGLTSQLGFIAIAFVEGGYGARIQAVVNIDVVATLGLAVVLLLRMRSSRRSDREGMGPTEPHEMG